MRRMLSLIGILLILGVLFAGCGAGGGSAKKEDASTASADRAMPQGAPAQNQVAKPEQSKSAGGSPTAAPSPSPVPSDRKIIQNAQFDVKIKDSDDAVAHISQAARASGGYVQETRQSGTKQQGRTVNMTLRVPAGQYGTLIDLINGLGEVTQRREWTEDVTEQYVDLEARIKTQQIHLQQLNKLYERSGSIKEMMELEQEISRITADLESMEGRIRVLSNRVGFSTLMVNLYEPGVPAPIQPPRTVWERVKQGFTGSWNGVVNFTGNLAVFLAMLIPVLAYLAVIGAVGYLIYRAIQRRRPNRPGLPHPPEPPRPE